MVAGRPPLEAYNPGVRGARRRRATRRRRHHQPRIAQMPLREWDRWASEHRTSTSLLAFVQYIRFPEMTNRPLLLLAAFACAAACSRDTPPTAPKPPPRDIAPKVLQ